MSRLETDPVMICTSDIAGQVRGKAVPRRALDARAATGVGWTPSNVFITAFGPIAPSPWGALGDLLIRPDPDTLVDLAFPDWNIAERFVLGDIRTLDDTPWPCCLRGQLRAALDDLAERHDLALLVAFEHEFHHGGVEPLPGLGYALRAFRRLGDFPARLMAVLDAAGFELDTFMPEYGPGQCEVTVGPRPALRAADDAVVLRELVRATARGGGARASFAPMIDPAGVGNGVHVHFSLLRRDGTPVSHDATRPSGLSEPAGAFVAGVLAHLPEYLAMTASGVPSYLRLTPHRWSAAFNNLGRQDRESAVRICPVFGARDTAGRARGFHLEFRAADACASPYLLLAALVRAGSAGLDAALATPVPTERDLAALDADALATLGVERLAPSLDAALERLAASDWAGAAFGETLREAFVAHKRSEIEIMRGLADESVCARYTAAY